MQYLSTALLFSSLAVVNSKEFNVVLSTNDLGGDSVGSLSGTEPLVLRLDEDSMSEELIKKLEHSPNIVFDGLPNIPEFINSNEYNNMMKKIYGEEEEEEGEEGEGNELESNEEWGKGEEEMEEKPVVDADNNDASKSSQEQGTSESDFPENESPPEAYCSDCEGDGEHSDVYDIASHINHDWEEAIAKVTSEVESIVKPTERRGYQHIIAIKAPVLTSIQSDTSLKTLEATFEFSSKNTLSEERTIYEGNPSSATSTSTVTSVGTSASTSTSTGTYVQSISPSETGGTLNRTLYASNATHTLVGNFQENNSLKMNLPRTFMLTVALSLLVIAVLG